MDPMGSDGFCLLLVLLNDDFQRHWFYQMVQRFRWHNQSNYMALLGLYILYPPGNDFIHIPPNVKFGKIIDFFKCRAKRGRGYVIVLPREGLKKNPEPELKAFGWWISLL